MNYDDAYILGKAGQLLKTNHKEIVNADGIPISMQRNIENGWSINDFERYDELPDSVKMLAEKNNVGRTGFSTFQPQMSMQTWEETLYAIIADGTAVTAAAETIMVPNFTLPANYLVPGRTMRYTLFFRVSTVITTPGTITQRLRYGGVAGTVLAASGAYAADSTAASTNLTGYTEYWFTTRSAGATGTVMCVGRTFLNDVDDASAATIVANLAMHVIPVSAPATATVDTTAASALSPTWTQTAATGTMTVHLAVLESMS